MSMHPFKIGLLAALVTFVFFGVAINTQEHGWSAWYGLSRNGRTTDGVVTRLAPEQQQSCAIAYAIEGRRYEIWQSSCAEPVGANVRVTYSPEKPGFATTRSPAVEFRSLLLAPILMAIFAGAMAMWRATR